MAAKNSSKCACSFGWLALAIIPMAAALAALVNGAVTQLYEADILAWWKFGVAYLVGFALIAAAKIAKWKCVENCTIHRKSR